MEYPGNMMTPDVCTLVTYLKIQCADRLTPRYSADGYEMKLTVKRELKSSFEMKVWFSVSGY